jgi:signal transduction histidine kinase
VAAASATLVELVRGAAGSDCGFARARGKPRQLLQTGDDERRRIERDLHDGSQQRLVSLGMALLMAQRHLDDGTIGFNDLIDRTVAELRTAVAELREIAHGLRPSSLDDGLHAALMSMTQNVPILVVLDLHPEPAA